MLGTLSLQVDIPLAHGVSWVKQYLVSISSCGQTLKRWVSRGEVRSGTVECLWKSTLLESFYLACVLQAPPSFSHAAFLQLKGSLAPQDLKEFIIRTPCEQLNPHCEIKIHLLAITTYTSARHTHRGMPAVRLDLPTALPLGPGKKGHML